MAQDWNLRARGHACSLCQRPLADRSPVVSALREVAGGGYERFDCHPGCWKAQVRDWEPFSQWDGIYTAPKKKEEKREALRREDAGELLRRLLTLDDPAQRNVVYVLAVMLERSRILVERGRREQDGVLKRVYEDRTNGDSFVVVDPRIRMENLPQVQEQVVALLSGAASLGELAAPPAQSEDPSERPNEADSRAG